MSANRNVQIIQPRNSLRMKLGGAGMPALDAGALARAEQALKSLAGQFQGWMEEEVTKLEAAVAVCQANGWTEETVAALFICSHDCKGLGATYEYPLVTRIAASLCKLTETPETRALAINAKSLLEAHVNAIKATVRTQIRAADDPVGTTLAAELEARAVSLLAGG